MSERGGGGAGEFDHAAQEALKRARWVTEDLSIWGTLKNEKSNVKLWRRPDDSVGPIDPVRCDGYLKGATAREFAFLFQDVPFQKKFDNDIKELSLVAKGPPPSLDLHLHVLHQEDSLPWPMANREHVFLSFTQPVRTEDGEVVWYHVEQTYLDLPGYQPKRGNVVTTKFISIMFRDLPGRPGECFATLVAEVDPKGNIPKSLINLKIGDARDFFADLSKAVAQEPGATSLRKLKQLLAKWDAEAAAARAKEKAGEQQAQTDELARHAAAKQVDESPPRSESTVAVEEESALDASASMVEPEQSGTSTRLDSDHTTPPSGNVEDAEELSSSTATSGVHTSSASKPASVGTAEASEGAGADAEETDEQGDSARAMLTEDEKAALIQKAAEEARSAALNAFVPLSEVDFIRKHSLSHRSQCAHADLIGPSLKRFQEYCEPTCKVWGSHTKSSSGLETWVSTTQDFSMGRVVIDAPVDLVADAVCADELRTTFNEKLEGTQRRVEFEDLAGNICGGYSYMYYKKIFPVSGRDFATLSYRFKDSEGVWWTPNQSVDIPDIIPEDTQHGRVRGTVFTGGYKVEPFGKNGNKSRLTFVAHADLGGSIPGFVRKMLVKAQPAVCLKVQDFFNDPALHNTIARTSFKHHPDLSLRPLLFAEGSLKQMLANRAVLDKQDAEEIATAAAQAAASRAAAELATDTVSLGDEHTTRGVEEGKLDEATADSVSRESQGEETVVLNEHRVRDEEPLLEAEASNRSSALEEVEFSPTSENHISPEPSAAAPQDGHESAGSPDHAASSTAMALESGPSMLQSAADALDSLLDEFFSAVADDISASTSSDAANEGNGASARKKKRHGVVVFEIKSCGQWVLDLAAGVVQRHPAGTPASVAGFDPKKKCLVITCKEKVFVSLVTGRMSPVRAVSNIKLRGDKSLLRSLVGHLRAVGAPFRPRFQAAAKAAVIAKKAAALTASAIYQVSEETANGLDPKCETNATPIRGSPPMTPAGSPGHPRVQQKPTPGGGGDGSDLVFFMDASMWVPNKAAPDCSICGSTFRLMLRRHHCRVCGEVVCARCSDHKLFDQRACTLCFQRFSSAKLARKAQDTPTQSGRSPSGTAVTSARVQALRQSRDRGLVTPSSRSLLATPSKALASLSAPPPPGAYFYRGQNGDARGPFLYSALAKWHELGMLSGSIRAHIKGEPEFSSTVAELLARGEQPADETTEQARNSAKSVEMSSNKAASAETNENSAKTATTPRRGIVTPASAGTATVDKRSDVSAPSSSHGRHSSHDSQRTSDDVRGSRSNNGKAQNRPQLFDQHESGSNSPGIVRLEGLEAQSRRAMRKDFDPDGTCFTTSERRHQARGQVRNSETEGSEGLTSPGAAKTPAVSDFSADPLLQMWLRQRYLERLVENLTSARKDGDDADNNDTDDQELLRQSPVRRVAGALLRRVVARTTQLRATATNTVVVLAAVFLAHSLVAQDPRCFPSDFNGSAAVAASAMSSSSRLAWTLFAAISSLLLLPSNRKGIFLAALVGAYSLLWHFRAAAPMKSVVVEASGALPSVVAALRHGVGACVSGLLHLADNASDTPSSAAGASHCDAPPPSGVVAAVMHLPVVIAARLVLKFVHEPVLSAAGSLLSDLASASVFVSIPLALLLAAVVTVQRFFGRLLQIYGLGFTVIGCYASTNWIMQRLGLSERVQSRIFTGLDHVFAPYTHANILELRSVFVKFGQYLGARTDIVPPTWAKVLGKLHDTVPACPPGYVRAVLENEFLVSATAAGSGSPASDESMPQTRLSATKLEDIFQSVDLAVPLASASVAQVHSGVLKNGTRVAIKVQHRNIRALIKMDMEATNNLVAVAAWLNPDRFNSLKTLMATWKDEVMKELDFKNEAANVDRAHANLTPHEPVSVPKSIPGLVAGRCFAMTFIDGFKVNDLRSLRLFRVDREVLARRIIRAVARQIFIDGFFNADPHPGNIFVTIESRTTPPVDGSDTFHDSDDSDDEDSAERVPIEVSTVTRRVRPVLLDFGMTVEVSEKERLAYAKLVSDLSNLDFSGLSQTLREVGYSNNQTERYPTRDLEFFLFMMRDTGNTEGQRQEMKDFHKAREERQKEDKAKGDSSRRYIKDLPRTFLFFFRTMGLMRGLCATLDVKLPYLDLLAVYARQALVAHSAKSMPSAPTVGSAVVHGGALSQKYQRMLTRMVNAGQLIGVQLCVLKGENEIVIDATAGYQGFTDARLCTSATRFPVVGLGNLPLMVIARALLDAGLLNLSTTAADMWPEAFKGTNCTVLELLSHQAELSGALPTSLAISAPDVTNWSKVVAAIESHNANLHRQSGHDGSDQSLPLAVDPGLVHGWILAEIILRGIGRSSAVSRATTTDAATNASAEQAKAQAQKVRQALKAVVSEHIAKFIPKAPANSIAMFFKTTSEVGGGASKDLPTSQPNQAVLSNHIIAEAKALAAANGMSSPDGGAAVMGSVLLGVGSNNRDQPNSGANKSSEPANGSTNASGTDSFGLRSLFTNFFCDFGLVNMEWATDFFVPGIGGHATAREVAEILRAYASNTADAVKPVSWQKNHPLWGEVGFDKAGMACAADGSVFGTMSVGGSVALRYPASDLTVCILVNDLTLSRNAVGEICSAICDDFDVDPVM